MSPIMRNGSRRESRGFSLVEVAMSLAIGALIMAGAMLLYANAEDQRRYLETVQETLDIEQIARSLYQGQPSFTGLTENDIVSSSDFPVKWKDGTNIGSPWHSYGYVRAASVVMGAGIGNGMIIGYHYTPPTMCLRMLLTDPGPQNAWAAASGGGGYLGTTGQAASIAQATAICVGAGIDVALITDVL